MYSESQKKRALKLYDQYKSITKVIQCLGYPTRQALYRWGAIRDLPPKIKALRKNGTIRQRILYIRLLNLN